MGALSAFKKGTFGVQLNILSEWQVERDQQTHLELSDTETGVRWHFFFFPDLHMDISEFAQPYLAGSLPAYARLIFEQVFPALNSNNPKAEPRTKDPTWSPLVDVEYLTVGGAPALRTVHRMAYQPGREVHLGHVLIPLKRGLFEARVVTADAVTGGRECVLMLKQDRDAGAGEMTIPPQAQMDDPKHDASFPDHCLSRARAALRWLVEKSGIQVLEPAPTPRERKVMLRRYECSFTPPPGFTLEVASDEMSTSLTRVGFCGTDGIEQMQLLPLQKGDLTPNTTAAAQRIAREIHEGAEVNDIDIAVQALPHAFNRPSAVAVVNGIGHQGPLRNVLCFFADEMGRPWCLLQSGGRALPTEDIVQGLVTSMRSFRRLAS